MIANSKLAPRLVVTGGAGFIGSHLVDVLAGQGFRVAVLDNFSTGRQQNIAHLSAHAGVEIYPGSILDAELVDRLVAGSQGVYHLAAAVGVTNIVRAPLASLRTNVHGTEMVLDACYRHGVRVVLASTSEIYGKSAELPFVEDGPRVLGATSIHRWGYSTAKALDEHLAYAYADQGLAMSIVRYFNAYGPRLNANGYGSVVARFIQQALNNEPLTIHGDGQQIRCFTYVADTVRGTLLAGTQAEAIGQVFNIGSPVPLTINELAEMVIRATGSRSPVVHIPYHEAYGSRFEDTYVRVPDTRKAEALLGFRAETPIEMGLQETLRGIKLEREDCQ